MPWASFALTLNALARRVSIATRLMLAFGLLLALLAGVVMLGLRETEEVAESSRLVAESNLHQVLLVRDAEGAAQAGMRQLYLLLSLERPVERKAVYATLLSAHAKEEFVLSGLLSDATAPDEAQALDELRMAYARFNAAFCRTAASAELDPVRARSLMIEQTLPALNEMLRTLDEWMKNQSAQANAMIAAIGEHQAQSRGDVLRLCGLAVLVALIGAVWITRSITRPLSQTVALAGQIADGELDGLMPEAGRDEVGQLITALAEMRNSLVQREARIVHLAFRDSLTGLANRTLFNDRLEQAVGIAARTGNGMSMLLIDLDRFKDVNDVLGHPVGDALLIEVAGRLTRRLRRITDTIARIGGDEFAVLLPAHERDGAVTLAGQILAVLDMPVTIEGHTVDISGSIGIVSFPADGGTASELMARADAAMYAAKQASSGYAVFDSSMAQTPPHGLSLLSDLRRAVEENELYLEYQPKISLTDGACVAAEVLLRWRHPTRGFVPPDQFVPFAEQTGYIKFITQWVLAQALRQLGHWHASGLEMSLNINISTRDLVQQDLPKLVQAQLDVDGIAARYVCLE